MDNILTKNSVLVINKYFAILGVTCPQKAFISMCSSNGENIAAKAVIVDYPQNENGEYNFESPSNIQPVFWDEWVKQPIRPFDDYISTPKLKIRIPSVLQAVNCTTISLRRIKPTIRNLMKRYNNRCAYTNKELSRNSVSRDHIIPKSRWFELGYSGSPDTWNNLVPCDKSLNHKKGNRLNEEINLILLQKHKEPAPLPASSLLHELKRDWEWFVFK